MTRLPLSVVILARNEAINIERCVRSAVWCGECVVLDDFSTDETVALATACGARVVQRKFDSFAGQRNWALEHAELRSPWILMLDADEELTEPLRSEIERALASVAADVAAFQMCRKTMFLGRWLKHSDGFPVWIMRLVRRGKARFVDCGHGEVPVPPVEGKIATLREPFLHFPFSRGISDWVARHNAYATREAELELRSASEGSWRGLFSRDRADRRRALRRVSRRMPCRPLLRFVYQYLLKWGFLEGREGFAYSWLMAQYEGLIVLKRWELERRAKGLDV